MVFTPLHDFLIVNIFLQIINACSIRNIDLKLCFILHRSLELGHLRVHLINHQLQLVVFMYIQ